MMMTGKITPQMWAIKLTHILNAYAYEHERFPVDVKSLAIDYSGQKYPDDPILKVSGDNLPNFEGGLFKAQAGKKGWAIIYNNSVQSKGRINFTLAHELGHYLLHRLEYPEGIKCGEQDMVRWESDYGQIEHQANVFAATLLMPLDDYRKQINPKSAIDMDMIGHCSERYGVSFIAAALRWIEYTERRAVLVVSRDGFILWARSSKAAYRSGVFIKTSNTPPIEVPLNSGAADPPSPEKQRQGIELPPGTWFKENCSEMVIFSDRYDFTISVLQLENNPAGYHPERD